MSAILEATIAKVKKQMDFIAKDDLNVIVREARLQPLLVRCGAGRFVCPAQDLEHFTACVAAGGDYVRDVSLYQSGKGGAK